MSTTLLLASIAAIGLLSQWLAWRTKAPSIVFLLAAGIIAGPLTGILNPDLLFGDLLFPIVSLSVAVILFEGALTLNLEEIRDQRAILWRMLSIGVLITWVVIAVATQWLIGLGWPLSILFGAVMVVTGPTVIGPMLRTVRPNKRVANLLRWEGVVIDPLGAVLALLVFDFILASQSAAETADTLLTMAKIVGVGVLLGTAAALALGWSLKKYWLPEYLHNVGTLMFVVFIFAVSETLQHESGLLAVTAMGLVLANMRDVEIDELLHFKESLSVLLISGLFVILAARLDLNALLAIGWGAAGVFLAVQFLARPLKILVSTAFTDLRWQERALLAWIAPRGIVAAAISSLFALRLEEAGFEGARIIVPLAFTVIIGTVVWQGLTAGFLARWLGIAAPPPTGTLIIGGNPFARALAAALLKAEFNVRIADSAWDNISAARMAGIPTYYGDAVSDHAERHLDLEGLGNLLALSQREDLNHLSCLAFRHEFGRGAIYTLPPEPDSKNSDRRRISDDHRGKVLFGEDMDYTHLMRLMQDRREMRTTLLTPDFDYDDYVEKWGDRALPLLAWDDKKRLKFALAAETFAPQPGDSVLSLVHRDDDPVAD